MQIRVKQQLTFSFEARADKDIARPLASPPTHAIAAQEFVQPSPVTLTLVSTYPPGLAAAGAGRVLEEATDSMELHDSRPNDNFQIATKTTTKMFAGSATKQYKKAEMVVGLSLFISTSRHSQKDSAWSPASSVGLCGSRSSGNGLHVVSAPALAVRKSKRVVASEWTRVAVSTFSCSVLSLEPKAHCNRNQRNKARSESFESWLCEEV